MVTSGINQTNSIIIVFSLFWGLNLLSVVLCHIRGGTGSELKSHLLLILDDKSGGLNSFYYKNQEQDQEIKTQTCVKDTEISLCKALLWKGCVDFLLQRVRGHRGPSACHIHIVHCLMRT